MFMKRALVIVVALAGVGGLIALLTYHPQSGSGVATNNTVPLQSSAATPDPNASPSPSTAAKLLKDGTYTGETVDVSYGPVQVQAVVSSGKLTAVNVLQMPSGTDHAVQLAGQSKPILVQEAIQAQSSNVDSVSGATLDSEGFSQSLQSALSKATSA